MTIRAARLLQLLELLRRQRRPVTGAQLAEKLSVSLRTLYRDIDALRSQGAHIDGDAGIGYVLRSGYLLPSLVFSADELEALVLGTRWVASQADHDLAQAADAALNRIGATLPTDLRLGVETSGLFVPRWHENKQAEPWLPILRRAIRDERVLRMRYRDTQGHISLRDIWPFAMAFFDPTTRMIAAWCELRADFRHFRAERVVSLSDAGRRYPQRRHQLIQRWREATGNGKS